MTDKQPLARSPQLTPLSHEHYDGLLFVWRIRQGLKKEASLQIMNDFIRWFWDNHLRSHFENEEKVLVSYLPGDDELVKRMMLEHGAVRELIPENKTLVLSQISLLAKLLHDHIRYEERDLFPYIEKKLSTAQLDEISAKLDHERSCSSEWKNEFWKN